MNVIAFTGPKGCGKDTCANYLLNRNTHDMRKHFEKNAFAKPIKEICHVTFGWSYASMESLKQKEEPLTEWPYGTRRKHLQDIANWFRKEYGADVWVNAWLARAADTDAYIQVITDLRFPNELEMLKKLSGKIIYVERPEAERDLKAAQESGDALANNVSEQHYTLLRNNADFILYNGGSLDTTFTSLDNYVTSIFGYRTTWPSRALRAGEY